jgi:3'(2'), 5'-bisphosphate nucleotidase
MLLKEINFVDVIEIARLAGKAILDVYKRDFSVEYKDDQSPLTEADLAAHQIIQDGLCQLTPQIPLLSEESESIDWQVRQSWECYWLIDPLDGTKEFLKRNGEFTVNIALVSNGIPVWGVVYAPAIDVMYHGGVSAQKSFKESSAGNICIQVKQVPLSPVGWRIVGSKSHQTEEFSEYIKRFDSPEITNMGSSLKICLVAEGVADLYPRLGPTSEWDTAAAHAVLLGAGGRIINFNSHEELIYNAKESLLNPFFIAAGAGFQPNPL